MTAQILDKHLNALDAQLKALNSLLIGNLNKEYSVHSEILETIRSQLTATAGSLARLDEESEKHDQINRFHLQNLEVLKKHFVSISSDSFLNKIIQDFTIAAEQYLENIPDIVGIEYPVESFKPRTGDSFRIKMGYRVERWSLKLKSGFRSGANLFRQPSKRKEKNGDLRMLNGHLRILIQGYFFPLYIKRVCEIVKEGQNRLIESYLSLFDYENEFVQNGYKIRDEGPSVLKANSISTTSSHLSDFFDQHKNELELLIQRSGMLLSMNRWQNVGRNRDYSKSHENLLRLNKSWQNTFFALFEDWRFHEQLFAYIHSVRSARFNVWSIYTQRIRGSLLPEVEKQLEYTNSMLDRLPDPDTSDMDKIRSFFVSELYKLKKEGFFKEQQEHLLKVAEDIPKLLQKLENEVSEKLDIFTEKVGIVSNPKYINGVKPSEIFYFSPGEFIEFEYIRDLGSELDRQRSRLGNELRLIINEFGEFDQIIDFYLDSAISLAEKPGIGENEVISFFKDGLQRLIKICQRISELLNGLNTEKLSELSALLEKFLESIAELNDNNNIINIYARLLKSKAFMESRSKQKILTAFANKTFSKLWAALKSHTSWFKSSYSDLKKKLRLDTSSKSVSSDISSHLTDIQHRIYTLPVIYQHLFEKQPIKEVNLFLAREEEIKGLNAAFDQWSIDKFAASLVIGENGSGKSSLLNYYSKTLKSNYQTESFNVSGFYYTEIDYYKLIAEIFGQDELSNDQDIDAFIQSFNERRIVIIDGLERLFIRKVNGFICLQKLLSLIVSTNYQIFWICSVSKYAAEYLDKTIALSEHFDYAIRLDSLSSEQIQSIVLKRNRLSGFQLRYQMGNSSEGNTRNKKLSQAELEGKFFSELNQFAGSNISLSLNYWLQSISSIQEDIIEIGSFAAPDFSFLDSISLEKAYTLLVVVIHGKISVKEHALIFGQKIEKSYNTLTILKEDSILVKQEEYFILNGILFSHVIRVLKNRNLIH